MMKRAVTVLLIVFVSMLLFGCSGEKLDLKLLVRMEGQPAAQAKISVDGKEEGTTDAQGLFAKTIRKKPGAEVEVVVSKEVPGYRIKPWKGTFLMKLPKEGTVDTYSFTADLEASRYITIVVTEKGVPVTGALVSSSGKEMGKTDAKGEFVYEYKELSKAGADISVSKPGYAVWKKISKLEPGQKLDVSLAKRVMVTINAMAEEYGQSNGIQGIEVSINGKPAGKTDPRGVFIYQYNGEPGRKTEVVLSAQGYIPSSWKTTVALEGEVWLQRYFYPTKPRPIRTGIYRFISNTPGADLKDILLQTEQSWKTRFSKMPASAK